MPKNQKSTTLYAHPFSRAYWKDAAAELKDTRMLVVAALMIALRVALKMVYIPLAPNLKINTAFIANAMGAMIFGPVVAMLAAVVSDVLGVMLSGEVYFVPFVLTEVAGSLIFALFLYRAKLTPTRVTLSRFCICFFVNILLQTPLMMLYYQLMMGGKVYVLTLPHIFKNLFMFPLESVLLTLLLAVIQPITYRMKLTYNKEESLRFTKKQVGFIAGLFLVGCVFVTGYLFYHYDHNSISGSFTKEERYSVNCQMGDIILDETDDWDQEVTAGIVESAYRKFGKGCTTYNVALYTVDEEALEASGDTLETVRGLSKSPAAKHEALTRVATAQIQVNNKTGEVLEFSCAPEN